MKTYRNLNQTFLILFVILLLHTCSHNEFQAPRGTLYIIGGGPRPPGMISEMITLAGGDQSRFLIISSASSDPADVGAYQMNQFLEYGAAQARWIHITAENANADTVLSEFEEVTGIFFSGGDQSRLTRAMLGSKSLEQIRQLYQAGALIAGTSAGAAVMSKAMITGNELTNPDSSYAFGDLLADNIEIIEGLGFLETAIIDQHHIRRKRFNRLLTAVLEQPKLIGIGIDESTALIVYGDGMTRISGERCVYILDAHNSKNLRRTDNNRLSAQDLTFHVLSDGDGFDLNSRRPVVL